MDHFNNLSPAELERLAILAEECNEVGQLIGKILRHGFESSSPVYHPMGQDTNRELLFKEILDTILAVMVMVAKDDFKGLIENTESTELYLTKKLERLNKYYHHNKITQEELVNCTWF